ncbi:MAG: 50S ribosomal protein L44e [Candidatus Nanohaloarchaea archaeon]|nr:50S ribosomal protein L44e [Candidatus Nanohaloarchaea archaeon]
MVEIPKEKRTYCPHCDSHQEHRVKEDTNKPGSAMKKKQRKRQRKIEKGYGSFPFEDPAHRSRGRKNPTSEKKDLVLECKECGKAHKPKKPIRAASFSIE